jgi:AcrR family transcriptional regulator
VGRKDNNPTTQRGLIGLYVYNMDGFARRTEEKMIKIEEAAISFLNLGLDNIKIADIAAKAKVSQVSIYNYYGSKDKLFEAAFRRLMNRQIQWLEKAIDSDILFEEKIIQLISFKKQAIDKLSIFKNVSLDRRFDEFLKTLYHESFPVFVKFIQSGKRSGNIREDIRDETLIIYFDMIVQSLFHIDKNILFTQADEKIELEILDLFLYGILKESK